DRTGERLRRADPAGARSGPAAGAGRHPARDGQLDRSLVQPRAQGQRHALPILERHDLPARGYFLYSFAAGKSFTLGNVVSTRFLKCTSWGSVLECNCRPMGPSLMRSGSGSRQSTTWVPFTATRTRLPWAKISRSFQSCCLPTFLAGPPSTGSPLRPKRSY